eukprot:4064087-Pleurochrysis_carterae.AAC.2
MPAAPTKYISRARFNDDISTANNLDATVPVMKLPRNLLPKSWYVIASPPSRRGWRPDLNRVRCKYFARGNTPWACRKSTVACPQP